MSARQFVRIEVDGQALNIAANVPLPVAVCLLETAKAKLIADALTPPKEAIEGQADPNATTVASRSRAPAFLPRSVA